MNFQNQEEKSLGINIDLSEEKDEDNFHCCHCCKKKGPSQVLNEAQIEENNNQEGALELIRQTFSFAKFFFSLFPILHVIFLLIYLLIIWPLINFVSKKINSMENKNTAHVLHILLIPLYIPETIYGFFFYLFYRIFIHQTPIQFSYYFYDQFNDTSRSDYQVRQFVFYDDSEEMFEKIIPYCPEKVMLKINDFNILYDYFNMFSFNISLDFGKESCFLVHSCCFSRYFSFSSY